MVPKIENLKELIEKAQKTLEEKYSDIKYEVDHAAFLCEHKENYSKLKKELLSDAELIIEIPHSGRNLSVYSLKEPIKINGDLLERIEILEPKPSGEQSGECFWEHIALKVDDLDAIIEKYKKTENALTKIRQIGNDKFGYHIMNGFRIQFRNNYFGLEDTSPEKMSLDDSTNNATNDYKELFEKEKESKLRILADIENERKRLARQREEFAKLANMAIINDLFEIVDDLYRAIHNGNDQESIQMIYNKLLGTLNNYGVVPVDVKEGDKYDANSMEAITTTKSDKDGCVVHLEQNGFMLKEDNKIIRPARVIVGKA